MAENNVVLDRHLLLCLGTQESGKLAKEQQHLIAHFCGRVLFLKDDSLQFPQTAIPHYILNTYFCGDASRFRSTLELEPTPVRIRMIQELCTNLGEVPQNLHNLAVYYPTIFGTSSDKDCFNLLQKRHKFQALTESNKSGTAFRKGVYLCNVETDGKSSRFQLLRCSANLSGPTLAFAEEDREIVAKINDLANAHFETPPQLNHVLAQVYTNSITADDAGQAKEHKAKIKCHSDKTKDMPANGVIAFVTFYSPDVHGHKPGSGDDRFDRYYKNASVLTRLRFRLKADAALQRRQATSLPSDFDVPLHPNSVLLIPLSSNRLHTHEIVPPVLPVGRFPTRLGYVVRCSKTKAVFKNGATYLQKSESRTKEVKLGEPQDGEIAELKELYRKENVTAEKVEYRDFDFSLNRGDYLQPGVG